MKVCCTYGTARPAVGPRTDGEKDEESSKKKTLLLAARIFFFTTDGANRSFRQVSAFSIRASVAILMRRNENEKVFLKANRKAVVTKDRPKEPVAFV